MKRVTWLYVLKLQNGNYYTGTTVDLSRRFDEHWNGTASAWTNKYPPISVDSVYRDKSNLEEDLKVKELMSIYGIDKVRGGSYSNVTLIPDQIKMLERELNHGKGSCLDCGSPDHWVKDCPKEIPIKVLCLRCGWDNHNEDKCRAKINMYGDILTNEPIDPNNLTIKELKAFFDKKKIIYSGCKVKADYVSLFPKLNFTKVVCSKCGRDSHTKERCYAKTHVLGHSLEEVKINSDKLITEGCAQQ
jgi:predicted GIY-YIG superfamily endonuclease